MKISEVSRELDISIDTLRYYEKMSLIGPVERQQGIRIYSQSDLNRILFVKCLRDAGVSIEALGEYIMLLSVGPESNSRRLEILEEEYARISNQADHLINALSLLNLKIQNYKSKME